MCSMTRLDWPNVIAPAMPKGLRTVTWAVPFTRGMHLTFLMTCLMNMCGVVDSYVYVINLDAHAVTCTYIYICI